MKRIFVEKKPTFDVAKKSLIQKINAWLHIEIKTMRIFDVYDIDKISHDTFIKVTQTIFSEINVDNVYTKIDLKNKQYIATKNLAAQFDARANSAIECIKILDPTSEPRVWTSKLYVFEDALTSKEIKEIKNMLINPVEMEEKDLSKYGDQVKSNVQKFIVIKGFNKLSKAEMHKRFKHLALTIEDLLLIQKYFQKVKRDPTETEIALFDTYWSDHCRHSTFLTKIIDIKIQDQPLMPSIVGTLDFYKELKTKFAKRGHTTLMNMATIMSKFIKSQGLYQDLDESDEINAYGFFADAKIDDTTEKWLIQFKNETHNHPTEIEPFGGAATCLGGAIRDPLSGRAYVYQAMRISGAACDLFTSNHPTLPNKLLQKKISQLAAQGFSSYGNQIGLTTAYVQEISHPNYVAKRMELGVVVGASPANYIKRESPEEGDIVVLIGGRTGRDGIGGATGSSKKHDDQSINLGAEVQKGNPIEERKIQRLMRNPLATRLNKKANDFGAGGVVVAIGEIAESIEIYLDVIPRKYRGLNATEVAISESQERMAILIDPKNLDAFQAYCDVENIESTVVAKVTNNHKLALISKKCYVAYIDRDFLNTNGYQQHANALIDQQEIYLQKFENHDFTNQFYENLTDVNVAAQIGLNQIFDSSIGNSTILAPFGGEFQLSPSQVSVQKLPVGTRFTDVATMLAFGYNPFITSASPYLGGINAVIEALAKIVAAGGNLGSVKLSFQEYFERMDKNPKSWGKPVAALLGTMEAMRHFNLAGIGGKDSMSGTFNDIKVPPTIIAFALSVVDANNVISTEFKKIGNYIYLVDHQITKNGMPDFEQIKINLGKLEQYITAKKIVSAFAISFGGIAAALAKMAFGNNLGFNVQTNHDLFNPKYGAIVIEAPTKLDFELLGEVTENFTINGILIEKEKCKQAWLSRYDEIFPIYAKINSNLNINRLENQKNITEKIEKIEAKITPKVLITVFPGTNCEYDIERKFSREGAKCTQFVFRNQNQEDIHQSIETLSALIQRTNILVIPGGFSAGDEPDGSGKYIATVLNNKKIKAAIREHIAKGGLILGICNGFQALVKSGILPFEKEQVDIEDPTLFKNDINAHVAKYVNTRVSSNHGPWLKGFRLGEIHTIPLSHGEGKFVVNATQLQELITNNQIAFQYVDLNKNIANDGKFNPNGSIFAIEGIISKSGQILGKMGHSERYESNIAKNIYGNKDQNIFRNAVQHFLGE